MILKHMFFGYSRNSQSLVLQYWGGFFFFPWGSGLKSASLPQQVLIHIPQLHCVYRNQFMLKMKHIPALKLIVRYFTFTFVLVFTEQDNLCAHYKNIYWYVGWGFNNYLEMDILLKRNQPR